MCKGGSNALKAFNHRFGVSLKDSGHLIVHIIYTKPQEELVNILVGRVCRSIV